MLKKIGKFIGKFFLYAFLASIFAVILFKFVPIPFTPLMFIRTFEQISEGKSIRWKHDWVSIDKMSLHIQKAVIASEDGTFTTHNGFDMKAMEKAMQRNKTGKKLRGGSTISQQTAKNVFLWPQRSYVRKGFEAYFTVLIEWIWGKERIMEVYLNSIEMGDGIYGIEAASQHWFNKSAGDLSKREAAAIAAILPNPRKFKANNGSAYIQKRIHFISKQMNFYNNPSYQSGSNK